MASDALSPTNSPSQSVECLLCGAVNSRADSTCASCGSPLSPTTPVENSLGALDVNQIGFARALPPQSTLRSGDYRVLGVLGQGGFGITYRAANERLGREVAIKEFFPATCERVGRGVSASGGLSEPEFASLKAAFLEEARVLARFELPAVVRVMGVWEENASAYMEMELLRGPTLAQVLDERGKLPIDDTVRLFAPLLDALEHIHAQGWLHRDIKPHNIIFEPPAIASAHPAHLKLSDCRAVLLDFGAAKKLAANTSQAFSVIVTPGYAPLEQYATRARRGAFTDIYALCATVYHALSGQAPPAASDRALYDDLIPLRELRPEVPAVLARAIEAGLRTEIARRPQNISELRQLLASRTGPVEHTPDAVDALTGEAGSRPNLGRLSARQQARLNSIHSANQDAAQKPPPPVEAPRLPVPSVRQVLADAIESERRAADATPAPKPAPAAAVEPAVAAVAPHNSGAVVRTPEKAAAPALPQARSTAGATGQGGHAHRSGLGNRVNHNAPEAWNNATYFVAAGIALIAVGPLLLIANALLSAPPPPPPPPVVIPQSPPVQIPRFEGPFSPPPAPPPPAPRAAVAKHPAIFHAQMSPNGRYLVGRTRGGESWVWDVARQARALNIGRLPTSPAFGRPFVRGRSAWWAPGGRYLLVLDPESMKSEGTMHRAPTLHPRRVRLFDVERRRQLWEKEAPQGFDHPYVSWDMERASVWACLDDSMRRFSLATGRENTPADALAVNETMLRSSQLTVLEDTPVWLGHVSRPVLPQREPPRQTSNASFPPFAWSGSGSRRGKDPDILVGRLEGTRASRFSVEEHVGLSNISGPLTSAALVAHPWASSRGRWLMRIEMPTPTHNVVRFVSFDGKLKRRWRGKVTEDSGAVFIPFASPDGRTVAHLRHRNLLRLWDVETGADRAVRFAVPKAVGASHHRDVDLLLWDRAPSSLSGDDDGSRWLIADADMDLRLFDARLSRVLAAPGIRATAAVFSEDEKTVFWINEWTGAMGQIDLADFSQRVKSEMVDAATSRPQVLAP